MPFKLNIGTKQGKTFKLEIEGDSLIGKELHDKIKGKDISPDLEDYEFEITGASDKSGFTALKEVEGIGLKKVLLSYEKGMKKRPRKEGKKKIGRNKPKGLRLRKTVRGKVISEAISQINLKVLRQGKKKLEEIFPEQNAKDSQVAPPSDVSKQDSVGKKEVKQVEKEEVKQVEKKGEIKEEKAKEEKKEEVKEE